MKEVNLTEGSIFQKLIRFSLPMIAGNLLQQIYNLVDTLIVGKCIGADALASVGSAYTLMIFITSIIIGFVSLYLNSWYTGKVLGYTFWKQLRDIAPSFAIAFTIAISVYFLKYLPISNAVTRVTLFTCYLYRIHFPILYSKK